jgi:hypothetical protein
VGGDVSVFLSIEWKLLLNHLVLKIPTSFRFSQVTWFYELLLWRPMLINVIHTLRGHILCAATHPN